MKMHFPCARFYIRTCEDSFVCVVSFFLFHCISSIRHPHVLLLLLLSFPSFHKNLARIFAGYDPTVPYFLGSAGAIRIGGGWPFPPTDDPREIDVPHVQGGAGWAMSRGLVEHLMASSSVTPTGNRLTGWGLLESSCTVDDVDFGEFLLQHVGVEMEHMPSFWQQRPTHGELECREVTFGGCSIFKQHCGFSQTQNLQSRLVGRSVLLKFNGVNDVYPLLPTRFDNLAVWHCHDGTPINPRPSNVRSVFHHLNELVRHGTSEQLKRSYLIMQYTGERGNAWQVCRCEC